MHESHIKDYIAKKDLVDKTTYKGICRNADEAVWCADTEKFIYMRTKFNTTFPETIHHPDDDKVYDVFYPLEKKEQQ